MQKRIAGWNSARRVWETSREESILCEHLEPYLETWPSTGMMRDGQAFELPTQRWEPPTSGSALSSSPSAETLFRTPTASETAGGMLHPETARAKGQTLKLGSQIVAEFAPEHFPGRLFPTPVAQEAAKAPAAQTAEQKAKTGQVWLTNVANSVSVANGGKLLPTPKAGDSYLGTPSTSGRPVEKSTHLSTIVALQSGLLEHRREPSESSGRQPEPKSSKGTTGGSPEIKFLPTPNTMDTLEPRQGEAIERQLRRGGSGSRRSTSGNLREDILLTVDPERYSRKPEKLLPTPSTSEANGAKDRPNRKGGPTLRNAIHSLGGSTGEPTSPQFDVGSLL